jgi:hypothetical protein
MCGEFPYQLSNCWLLRNDFSSWNQHAILKTVGILGCDGEEVLELTRTERNAGNLSTWNCTVSILCICPDQYRIWLHSLTICTLIFSALFIKVICLRLLLSYIWLSAEWHRDHGERCLSLSLSLSTQFADHSWGTPTFVSVEYRGCSGLKLTISSAEVKYAWCYTCIYGDRFSCTEVQLEQLLHFPKLFSLIVMDRQVYNFL